VTGRRGIVLAALVAAAFTLVCVGSAGAGSERSAAPATASALHAQLATSAGAASYLRTLGIDPAGVVVQRGDKNYAGPACPGRGWTCTTSRRVLQLSSTGGTNTATCLRAGSGSGVTSQTCVIVQSSTSGNNKATCTERATAAGASVVQDCKITQTAGSGTNEAIVEQTLTQGPSCDVLPVPNSQQQEQASRQTAKVVQASPAGAMSTNVTQNVIQCTGTTTTGAAAQRQSTFQEFTIVQGPAGFDPANPVCTGKSGALEAHVSQTQRHGAHARSAVSGSQAQDADLIGNVDQCSNSHAHYSVVQRDDQRAFAPTTVAQDQNGPVRCCSFQGTNPADTCRIEQVGSQQGHALADQFESIIARAGTSGNCRSDASVTQNGVTNTNSESGSVIVNDELAECQNGNCGEPAETALTSLTPTATSSGGTVTLSATLTRTDTSAGVPGLLVTLTLGTQSCTDTTDSAGVASCSLVVDQPPGPVTLTATFAGNDDFAPATASVPFTIEKAATMLVYTGPTSGKKGTSVTVSARLTLNGAPVAGKSVSFTLGSGASLLGTSSSTTGLPSCTGNTNAQGVASCSLRLPYSTGTKTLYVRFAGDASFQPAATSVAFVVRAY
jgi:hypothetical protein